MEILQKIRQEKTFKSEWQALLGEEELEHILQQQSEYEVFLENNLSTDQKKIQEFLKITSEGKSAEEPGGEEWVFAPFYHHVCHYVQKKLDKVFRKRHLISVHEKMSESLSRQYMKNLQEISLRCLLQEMGELKENQKLRGENARQEYEFFLKRYLSEPHYLEKLIEKYPVMMELILQKVEAYAAGMDILLKNLEQEKERIEEVLCNGRKIKSIQKIEVGLSDEHKQGETVARLVFDNGGAVYYKPRSLKSELEYQRVYHWVSEKCGLKSYDRKILDGVTCGWEEEVTSKGCSKETEIWRYYERLGIHLCLTYLLGISDIHFENIIVCGEYPVLIDVEVFPGYRENTREERGTLAELLWDSVLSTGILPGQNWGHSGINASALGNIEKQRASFKVPVIKNRNTSNMCISYDYAELNCAECVPELQGQKVQANQFVAAVEQGFQEAYECVFRYKKEILEGISGKKAWKSRYVLRNTQQYRMYQLTASFPQFMSDFAARRLLLLRMNKGLVCKEEYREKILFYEAETVMNGMIPVYYVQGRNLELGNGTCIPDYFEESVWEQVAGRLKRMGGKDEYRQKKLIALSMSAVNCRQVEQTVEQQAIVTSHQIAERIQTDMEKIGGEVQWIKLEYGRNGGWQFQTMGMYLYDGIAGIAVFLMAYGTAYGMEKQKELRECVIERMFRYTDEGIKNENALQSRNTGIMNGESSFIYVYLLLYHISKEQRFLNYAKRHAQIVKNLMEEDQQFDILEGNAGAVIAMVHLYQKTGTAGYLEVAQQAADILLEKAVQMKNGVGWILQGQNEPLAGMAHGNSGIMLAFARLWKVTGVKRYYDIVRKARQYEDSLYDAKTGNWRDLRKLQREHNTDTVAWCHGAAGILIASIQTDCILKINPAEDWRVQIAAEKVEKTEKVQCCLCHGRMGNTAALRYGEGRIIGKETENFELPVWKEIPYLEKYQMGFMTGMSGIGYELLEREKKQLPEILALEL